MLLGYLRQQDLFVKIYFVTHGIEKCAQLSIL